MTYVDRLLQNWRVRVAGRYLKAGCRVLDIGVLQGIACDSSLGNHGV
jgi:hypothetical protein